MEIVACFDHKFVMTTGVMIYSVCANNREKNINFHLVCDESVSEKDEKDLKDIISAFESKGVFIYRTQSAMFKDFPICQTGRLPVSAFYLLLLTEILPKTIDKVLYLDGDCIIRHSLLPLWNIDVEGYAIAAVPDCQEGDIRKYNRLRYSSQLGYFNSGVMLINLDYWRKNEVVTMFADYVTQYPDRIKSADQDVFNVLFSKKKLSIPIKYNLTHGFLWTTPRWDYWKYEKEFQEALKDPVIIHFTGKKPWYKHNRFLHPYRSSFFKYQEQTVWKGYTENVSSIKERLRGFVGDILRFLRLKAPLMPKFINVPPVD